MLIPHIKPSILAIVLVMAIALVWIRTAGNRRIISVGLDMLLQVLRTFKSLSAEFASVRLQRDVDTDV